MSAVEQAAEKLNSRGSVTGHAFSRADKVSGMSRALELIRKLASDGAPASTGCGKSLRGLHEVSGHDFSRAANAAKLTWALLMAA
jgi:hypothetical protein